MARQPVDGAGGERHPVADATLLREQTHLTQQADQHDLRAAAAARFDRQAPHLPHPRTLQLVFAAYRSIEMHQPIALSSITV